MKYSYSSNGEEFQGMCDSIMDAISEACDDDDMAEVIYVGEAKAKTIGSYLWQSDIEKLLENIADQAHEECGEVVGDWLCGPPSPAYVKGESTADRDVRMKAYRETSAEFYRPLVDGVAEALEKWATKYKQQPGFWHVRNVKEYDREGNLIVTCAACKLMPCNCGAIESI